MFQPTAFFFFKETCSRCCFPYNKCGLWFISPKKEKQHKYVTCVLYDVAIRLLETFLASEFLNHIFSRVVTFLTYLKVVVRFLECSVNKDMHTFKKHSFLEDTSHIVCFYVLWCFVKSFVKTDKVKHNLVVWKTEFQRFCHLLCFKTWQNNTGLE